MSSDRVTIRAGLRALAGTAALAMAAACAAGSGGAGAPAPASGTPMVRAATPVAAGEYLTIVGGCNDCHTQGWAEADGEVPAAQRFTGSPVGYRGPWGTTYAANLRMVAQRVTEDRWVEILTTADGGDGKPPMPWMNTRQMNEADLRAIYQYIRGLGPAGERMPRAVPPGQEPTTPYIVMAPPHPGASQ